MVYINAIHDVYPNSTGSGSPYGIHVCASLTYIQNPHLKEEYISCTVNKTHASAFVPVKATVNQRNTATTHGEQHLKITGLPKPAL